MQTVFGVNAVALVDGQPQTLNLRELLDCFIKHRRDVVTRRTIFQLKKARARAHLLEGLAVALANIDPIIKLIKESPTPNEARQKLLGQGWSTGMVEQMLKNANIETSEAYDSLTDSGMQGDQYFLSEKQAKEILEMRLQRLTALEQDKIVSEYGDVLLTIADLLDILSRSERLMQVIREELITGC
jgi:DNA gyrase subunit A